MPGRRTHYTTDHHTIREWAEDRGGEPAAVKRTRGGRGKGDPGVIRLDFPGYSGADSLEHISWDAFFRKFDDNNLVFIYQDQTARGQQSNFNKLINAESVDTGTVGEDQIDRPRSSGRSAKAGRTTGAGSRKSTKRGTAGRSGSTSKRASGSSGGGRNSGARSAGRSGSTGNSRGAARSSGSAGSRIRTTSGSRSGGSRTRATARSR